MGVGIFAIFHIEWWFSFTWWQQHAPRPIVLGSWPHGIILGPDLPVQWHWLGQRQPTDERLGSGRYAADDFYGESGARMMESDENDWMIFQFWRILTMKKMGESIKHHTRIPPTPKGGSPLKVGQPTTLLKCRFISCVKLVQRSSGCLLDLHM